MRKTPFKVINWFSFYDQMNTDFFFYQISQNGSKIFLKKRKILHFWMDTGCFILRGWANIL